MTRTATLAGLMLVGAGLLGCSGAEAPGADDTADGGAGSSGAGALRAADDVALGVRAGGAAALGGSPGHPAVPALAGAERAAWVAAEQRRDGARFAFRHEGGRFWAPNVEHGFRAVAGAAGVEVAPWAGRGFSRGPAPEELRLTVRLTRWGGGAVGTAGVEASLHDVPAPDQPHEVDQRLLLSRGAALTEWYVNGPLGLEQGFTVNAPPPGVSERLVLEVDLGGAVTTQQAGPREVTLHGPSGAELARYGEPWAEDAAGRPLGMTMEARGARVWLGVDVRQAEWPVHVDPTIWVQQAELTHELNRVSARLGWAVAFDGTTVVGGAPYDTSLGQQGGALHVWARSGTTWTRQPVSDLTPSGGDSVGFSVAVSGDTMAAGRPGRDEAEANVGGLTVYRRAGTAWGVEEHFPGTYGAWQSGRAVAISASALAWSENAGSAVHVAERSGTTWTRYNDLPAPHLVVALAMDGGTLVAGCSGANPNGPDSGSASVFVRSGTAWVLDRTLVPTDGAAGDRFGASVAVLGATAVVGAYGTSGGSGGAYVFQRTGTLWAQTQKLAPTVATTAFGWSVAVESGTVTVGAPYDAAGGALYAFSAVGTSWVEQARINRGGSFGYSMAMVGGVVVAGAPNDDNADGGWAGSVSPVTRSGTTWTLGGALSAMDSAASDVAGSSAALSGDTAVLGAPGDDPGAALDAGAAWVFQRSGYLWSPGQRVSAADATAADWFGSGVAVDGNWLLAGAPGADPVGSASGAAYFFERVGTGFVQRQKVIAADGLVNHQFGASVALQGATALVGAPGAQGQGGGAGDVYFYARAGTTWAQVQKVPNPSGGTNFAARLALDGATAAFSSDYSEVTVFVRSGTTWALQQLLPPPAGAAGFGGALALLGNTLAVSAPSEGPPGMEEAGAAYVFVRTGTVWAQQARVTAAGGAVGDLFGYSLSLAVDRLLVGAPRDDQVGGDAGTARVFERVGTAWTETRTLASVLGLAGEDFGWHVAQSGPTALVGAPRASRPTANAGSGYVFVYTDPQPSGAVCLLPGDCASGYCVDGVCCNTPCAASCQACTAALKGSGSDGTCGNIPLGQDPSNDCSAQPVATCGPTGACNGAGGCQYHPLGTECLASTCLSPDAEARPRTCDGAGSCLDRGSQPCAAGFACVGSACVTTCTGDGDCASAYWCDTGSGQCVPDDPTGAPCTASGHCTSDACVDGVCCATACDGACWSCNNGYTGQPSGACAPVLTDTDPNGDCPEDSVASCLRDGWCDGTGQCRAYQPAGVVCGATTCTTDVVSGATCNGSGSCSLGTQACFPYRCSGSACGAACLNDSDCQSTGWCRITDNTCQADLTLGEACTSASQCASGQCADGVCCDTACGGTCQACTAARKGAGSDGTCGAIASGSDPDSECVDEGAATCGTTGRCGGSGSCALYAPGTACGATTCAAGTQTGSACDGFGTCAPSSTAQCAPYLCQSGSVCATSCSADTGCIASAWCDVGAGVCRADQPSGAACSAASQCQSGQCVDGVCCDQACAGACRACTAALKGAGVDGECGFVATGADPDAECVDDGATSCDRNGACNGAGACQLYPAGTACGATTCAAGTQTGYACDGFGSCAAGSNAACAPFQCSGSACATVCAADTDCVGSHHCGAGGACVPDGASGAPCSGPGQCASNYCVDGVCCDAPCTGSLCQACSAAKKGGGVDGECGPVAEGTDPDAECADEGVTSCGRDGMCSGAGACRLYAGGAACGSTTCAAGTQTGFACDGAGTCRSAQTTPCGAYLCAGSACGTTCTSDADCVPGAHCGALGTCDADLANGAACQGASQCVSSFCVDGVCCDQACQGACQSCRGAEQASGADGQCGPVVADSDPGEDCPIDPPSSCARDGQCNGAGACQLYGLGTVCGAATCAGSTLTGAQCNGLGACVAGSVSSCTPYACSSASTCGVACATSADCVPTAYCAGGTCAARLPQGAACAAAGACQSGFCVDGVCCNTACDGLCQACSAAAQAAGAVDGTCGPATDGVDPHDDCPDDGAVSCDRDGACDGAGRCRLYAAAVPCGAGRCEGTSALGYAAVTSACDGAGACLQASSVDCGLDGCAAGACVPGCAVDGDCARGAVCSAGACSAPLAGGEACAEGRECGSGFCVDGVCCDGPCSGQCEACDAAGAVGRCVPVLGAPHGARPACATASGADVCTATSCDGSLRGSCAGFAGPEVECRAASCADGTVTLSATCRGTGQCPAAQTASCAPYGCAGDACADACASDADCAADAACDTASGECELRVASCADAFTLVDRDGNPTDCSPYRCEVDRCRDSCRSSTDCATGWVCDDANSTCVEPAGRPGAAADDGGCGCRAPPRSAPGVGASLALIGAVVAAARRRRSACPPRRRFRVAAPSLK